MEPVLLTTHVPLRFGLAADIISEAEDRSTYVPPTVRPGEHHARCLCPLCVRLRAGKMP